MVQSYTSLLQQLSPNPTSRRAIVAHSLGGSGGSDGVPNSSVSRFLAKNISGITRVERNYSQVPKPTPNQYPPLFALVQQREPGHSLERRRWDGGELDSTQGPQVLDLDNTCDFTEE